MLCSPNKLVEAVPRGSFEILLRTLVDHPPDVARIIEEEPFQRPVSILTEA
jgi:hypothetical protein